MIPPAYVDEATLVVIDLVAAAILGSAVAFRPKSIAYEFSLLRACAFLAVAGALMMRIIDDEMSRAFGLMGAASIVRYRYGLRNSQDASSLVLALAVGLACGQQLWVLAIGGTGVIVALNGVFGGISAMVRPRRLLEVEVRGRSPELGAKFEAMLTRNGVEPRIKEVEARREKDRPGGEADPKLVHTWVFEVRASAGFETVMLAETRELGEAADLRVREVVSEST